MGGGEVYGEESGLVSEGVQWITLLGQNVNSYKGDLCHSEPFVCHPERSEGSEAQGKLREESRKQILRPEGFRMTESSSTFPELLKMLCQIEGLKRISFTTSHPQDATEELFRVIAQNPKISRRFHLPLQSGSNSILKRMKRLHTYQEYKVKIDLMHKIIPDISVTTDIITGFSGETEEDHQATMRALSEIHYDSAFIY